jgi:3-deoxy-D-manno-octulosonate 8-phosphate phosphatase (KDO 8-P phosphatase)
MTEPRTEYYWHDRCALVELLLLDVDGVLTDGRIILDDNGIESKNFSVRDGTGIEIWRKAGKAVGILSGRTAQVVGRRASELGILPVVQGASNKRAALNEIVQQLKITPAQVCFMGDDLPDLPVLSAVGLAVCPSDAVPEVRAVVHHTTQARGGHGAVRELVEWLLKQQRRWDALIANYSGSTG